ncbi:recombination protein NinB [Pseudomonas urethralis]|uniref:recombination protein NinB n=1 Tax=Pseudomonas urethralis TaxID=2740517 RepID=UPI0015969A7B|nr:recombination protein NinB [Pseudomonas urethralis]
MTEFLMRSMADADQLLGRLQAQDFTKPKLIVIRDEKRPDVCNRKMWAMLRDVSQQVEWYGRKLTDEDWKHIFSAAVQKQDAVPGIDGGFVVLGVSTRKQSQKWFSDLFEVMHAFGAEHGVRWTAQDHWEGRYS